MDNVFDNKKKKYIYIYYIIVSLVCCIVYLSGERTSFFLLILFFLTLFFYLKIFEKIYFVINLLFFILSIVLSSIQNSNNINPGHRMFVKTYNQIIGKNIKNIEDDGNLLKHIKKNFLENFIYFHMIIRVIIFCHIKFLKIIQ